MWRVVAVIAVLAFATALGSGLTVLLYSAWKGEPESLIGAFVIATGPHLLLCCLYSLLGESQIEDIVKSAFIAVFAGLLFKWFPLISMALISALVCGVVVNQSFQRALRMRTNC